MTLWKTILNSVRTAEDKCNLTRCFVRRAERRSRRLIPPPLGNNTVNFYQAGNPDNVNTAANAPYFNPGADIQNNNPGKFKSKKSQKTVSKAKPQKSNNNGKGKKTLLKIIAAVLIVCIVFAAVFSVSNAVSKNKFWNNMDVSISMNTDKWAEAAQNAYDARQEQDASFDAIKEYARDLTDEEVEFTEKYNEYIITYFNDVYSLDVTALIAPVSIYVLDLSGADTELTDGGEISALTDPDTSTIYLGSTLFDMTDEFFDEWTASMTYIHEMVHAIGSSDDEEMIYFCEGVTEYLTGLICEYSGMDYDNPTSYVFNTIIAGQMIEADPSFVMEIIGHYGEFDWKEYIDKYTDGYAMELENALLLIIYAGKSSKNLYLRAQYIAAEYCKTMNPDEAKEIVTESTPLKAFELRCLLHGWK